MFLIRSDLTTLVLAGALVALGGTQAHAQDDAARRIVSSEISISRENAELDLELDDGTELEYAIRGGNVLVDGRTVGSATRGSQLDRAWRDLLNSIMDMPTEQLPTALAEWVAPPGSAGTRLDSAIEQAVRDLATTPAPLAVDTTAADSAAVVPLAVEEDLRQLEAEKAQLERELERMRERVLARERGFQWTDPVSFIWRKMIDMLQILATYIFAVAVGLFVVLIAGRYLRVVSDTVRAAPVRSWAVGVAATFAAIPVYLLGLVALAISIIGIPAILVWAPLFPVALALAAFLGYLAVAHAVGQALAGWKIEQPRWFQLGASYYHMALGVGVLMVLIFVWQLLDLIRLPVIPELVVVLQVFLTWVAISIGLGAVLLSRFGTRRIDQVPTPQPAAEPERFEEESNV